jgi:hypothetical protein
MERWFRDEPIFSVAIFFGIAVIAISEFASHGTDLLTRFGFAKEKTLELATENAKGELSRKLVALASRRIFWTRNYYKRVELDRPVEELDQAWMKYVDTVADWSADLITNSNAMTEYYANTDKPAQFNRIHKEFKDLEGGMIALRTSEEAIRKVSPAHREDERKAAVLLAARVRSCIDAINVDVYFFALNEKSPEATPEASPDGTVCEFTNTP